MKTNTKKLVESVMQEASANELDSAFKQWGKLSEKIETHRVAFEAMISDKLKSQAALRQTIERTMDELKIKTHKVDNIVASIKAAYNSSYDASPKELWAKALTKVNEATRQVLLDIQTSMKKTKEVDKSFIIKKEGFMSNMIEKIKVLFKDLYSSIKGMDEPVAELATVANRTSDRVGFSENVEPYNSENLKPYSPVDDVYDQLLTKNKLYIDDLQYEVTIKQGIKNGLMKLVKGSYANSAYDNEKDRDYFYLTDKGKALSLDEFIEIFFSRTF